MDHAGHGSDGSGTPLDIPDYNGVLTVHILCMVASYGFIIPVGVVLGLIRSRWHVPTQIVGSMIAALGFFLGFMHDVGSTHHHEHSHRNPHSSFAWVMILALISQGLFGFYIKFYKKSTANLRKIVKVAHRWLGISTIVLAYVQMLLGAIVYLGMCKADHLGQCLAHFIMGSSFIAYGIILLIIARAGNAYMQHLGKSQEFWDSWVMTLWGIVNTFTEHRWGERWSHGDLQHTSLGVLWWFGGMLGIFMTRPNGKSRNIFPALVIIFTGVAMAMHAQLSATSGVIHSFFGYALTIGGVARIFEVLKTQDDVIEGRFPKHPLQLVSGFFIILAGCLFMSATEEMMSFLNWAMIDGVSYSNVVVSFAFFITLYALVLISIYMSKKRSVRDTTAYKSFPTQNYESDTEVDSFGKDITTTALDDMELDNISDDFP
ncbi:hypothetical protein K7432_002868 [Basidiobolus ranarum]|uniref:Cytochrome b561 domain-containing protein n=1 Tax=Basidiobolus ranarum TaxID=34480 RepID=A0ABR2X0T1_9FUNG